MSQSKYVFKISVPGHVLAVFFTQRESDGKDLLLNLSQGPYAMAQLMAHVSVVMKDERKRSTKYLKDTTSDVMRTDKVESTTPLHHLQSPAFTTCNYSPNNLRCDVR